MARPKQGSQKMAKVRKVPGRKAGTMPEQVRVGYHDSNSAVLIIVVLFNRRRPFLSGACITVLLSVSPHAACGISCFACPPGPCIRNIASFGASFKITPSETITEGWSFGSS